MFDEYGNIKVLGGSTYRFSREMTVLRLHYTVGDYRLLVEQSSHVEAVALIEKNN